MERQRRKRMRRDTWKVKQNKPTRKNLHKNVHAKKSRASTVDASIMRTCGGVLLNSP